MTESFFYQRHKSTGTEQTPKLFFYQRHKSTSTEQTPDTELLLNWRHKNTSTDAHEKQTPLKIIKGFVTNSRYDSHTGLLAIRVTTPTL